MMKRGILIAILIIVVFIIILVLLGGFVYLQFQQEPHVPDNAYLKIHLSGKIVDNNESLASSALSLRDLFYHLKRAKMDERIKGIILFISGIHSGFSKIEDIGLMIADFKKSGKKVVSFIESGGLIDYTLSTYGDEIFVLKGWDLFLKGLASEAIFIKNTLSKLGIQAEMYHIGEYKTAANMFTRNEMTPEHQESIQTLLDDIYQSVLIGIASRRNLKLEDLQKLMDQAPLTNDDYLKAGLIDRSLYEDEILKNEKSKYKIIDFNTYKETSSPKPYKGTKKIALIFASGEIHLGKSSSGDNSFFSSNLLGSETLGKQLDLVRKNPSCKAAVLRIDSPGGSALASEVIRRKIELLKKKKPLVISMSDLAASGGYWISLSGSRILAHPQTITGSIGVVGGKFVLKELYDTIGVNKEIIKTSRYADMFSDYKLFTPAEKQKFMDLMSRIYQSFKKLVSVKRNLSPNQVEKIARGRVWSGIRAKQLELIDQHGGLLEAIKQAKKLARIPESEKIGLQIYPKKKSLLDTLLELVGMRTKSFSLVQNIETKLQQYQRFFPALLMPYTIHIY
jgi:protease-4